MNVFKSVRNHWKKSLFASAVCVCVAHLAHNQIKINNIMIKYCKIAEQYGQKPIEVFEKRCKITILLNATNEKNWALRDYEKYCSPIFHLSGLDTNVIRLDEQTDLKTAAQQLFAKNNSFAGEKDVVHDLMQELENEKSSTSTLSITNLPLEENGSFLAKMINENNKETNRVETLVKCALEIVANLQGPPPSFS